MDIQQPAVRSKSMDYTDRAVRITTTWNWSDCRQNRAKTAVVTTIPNLT